MNFALNSSNVLMTFSSPLGVINNAISKIGDTGILSYQNNTKKITSSIPPSQTIVKADNVYAYIPKNTGD